MRLANVDCDVSCAYIRAKKGSRLFAVEMFAVGRFCGCGHAAAHPGFAWPVA